MEMSKERKLRSKLREGRRRGDQKDGPRKECHREGGGRRHRKYGPRKDGPGKEGREKKD